MIKIPRNTLAVLIALPVMVGVIFFLNKPEETKKILQDVASLPSSFSPQGDKKESSPVFFTYIEIIDSCGPYFDGVCVNARSGPSTEAKVIMKLRNGVVLKTVDKVTVDGIKWYRVSFKDEWLRYPERVGDEWYVAAEYTRSFSDEGVKEETASTTPTTKRIVVDLSDQKIYAYDDEDLFMEESMSAGLQATKTPRGNFTIYRKSPTRYMQGPIPGISEKAYDLPGVPWDLYFTEQGAVIHGAYWHDHFGTPWSNGCVNLSPPLAEKLYRWADVGTRVLVRD